jgi:KDO2-lipid IV(A) lauroyltransferase
LSGADAVARAKSIYAPAVWPTWLGLAALRLAAFLPYRGLLALGRVAGRLGERLASQRRHYVDRNLALCFPALTAEQRLKLRHLHFESVGMGVLEFAMAWWWSDDRLLPLAEVQGREHLEAVVAAGGGLILLSAHTTSLEIGGRVLQSLLPIHAMYRPNEDPVLQRFIEINRPRHVEGVISRDNPRAMMRVLKKGGAVWYAPDQNYRGKGHVFVDFFGVPAASNPATSRFAAVTGARVVPVVVLRKPGGGGYRLIVEPPFDDFPSDEVAADTRRMNRVIENWVREAPEQYNWLHRRFKTRPAGAAPRY